jgi:hypothetical protein
LFLNNALPLPMNWRGLRGVFSVIQAPSLHGDEAKADKVLVPRSRLGL